MGDDRQKLCPDMIPFSQALIRGLQLFLRSLQRFMIAALLRNVFIGMNEHHVVVAIADKSRRRSSPKQGSILLLIPRFKNVLAATNRLNAPAPVFRVEIV